MQNSIINACNNFEKESIYEKFLIQTIDDFKDNKNISINSKILHYLPNPTLYFYISVHKNTNINPFNNEIIISVEFMLLHSVLMIMILILNMIIKLIK